MSRFSENLKKARKGKYTLKELSVPLGISISYLSDLEHGRKMAPNLETVRKIEELLFITDNSLVNSASQERRRVPTQVLRKAQKNPLFSEILMILIQMDTGNLEKVLQYIKEMRCQEPNEPEKL